MCRDRVTSCLEGNKKLSPKKSQKKPQNNKNLPAPNICPYFKLQFIVWTGIYSHLMEFQYIFNSLISSQTVPYLDN